LTFYLELGATQPVIKQSVL